MKTLFAVLAAAALSGCASMTMQEQTSLLNTLHNAAVNTPYPTTRTYTVNGRSLKCTSSTTKTTCN